MASGGRAYRSAAPPQQGIPPVVHGLGPQSATPTSPQSLPYSLSPVVQMLARPPQQPNPVSVSQGTMSYPQQLRPPPGGLPSTQQQTYGLSTGPGPGTPALQPLPPFVYNSSLSYPTSFVMTPPSYQSALQSQPVQLVQSNNQPWSVVACQPPAISQRPEIVALSSPTEVASLPEIFSSSSQPTTSGTSDWQEHSAPDGRRYYYNERAKLSSWEKPVELMTSTERADASTVWKEFTTPEGKKYYHNKVTNKSKWTMPDEMKLAREQVDKSTWATTFGTANNEALVTTVSCYASSTANSNLSTATERKTERVSREESHDLKKERGEVSAVEIEEAKQDMLLNETANNIYFEENPPPVVEEPLNYASKAEAKNGFKELLEAVHVESDWTWDQAMRLIINDRRYGVLKTLGERKQTFNEYLAQRKKWNLRRSV